MQGVKRYTSIELKEEIKRNNQESRKEWLTSFMERAGKKNSHNGKSQFWQEGNHPVELKNNFILEQKLNYIHNNPVEVRFVEKPEDWLFSSARDYCGNKGLLDILLIQ